MHIQLTATSTANPSLFEHIVRSDILAALPGARVEVRALQTPAHRQFHTVTTDSEAAFLVDLLADRLPLLREMAADGDWLD